MSQPNYGGERSGKMLTASVAPENLGREFLDFMTRLDYEIIAKTEPNEGFKSFIRLKENYPPSFTVRLDERFMRCQGVDGKSMNFDEIRRGATGVMILRLQYFYTFNGNCGLKWGVEHIGLKSNGEERQERFDFLF